TATMALRMDMTHSRNQLRALYGLPCQQLVNRVFTKRRHYSVQPGAMNPDAGFTNFLQFVDRKTQSSGQHFQIACPWADSEGHILSEAIRVLVVEDNRDLSAIVGD